MKICVTGPSGAGKTALCRILHSVYPKLKLISGDAYIHRDRENVTQLVKELDANSNYIFEHVAAVSVLKHARNRPDFVAVLLPPESVLQTRTRQSPSQDQSYSALSAYYEDQTNLLRDWCIDWRVFSQSGAALASCVERIASNPDFHPKVQNFVVKVSSRCNLNCDYCYMYESFDKNWADEPALMSTATAQQVGYRISEHLRQQEVGSASVTFHGGEPLLLSVKQIVELVSAIRAPLADEQSIAFGIQTNGVRLSPQALSALDDLGFGIGISIDGAGEVANQHRLDHHGRPTFLATEDAIRRAVDHRFSRGHFGGVLCVVDPLQDGAATYQYFRSLGVRDMDFLLRDDNHETRSNGAGGIGVFKFLKAAFESWVADDEICNVRFFQSIISLLYGDMRSTDVIGLGPLNTLVVGTSGKWELLDSLRTCFEDAWVTGCNVSEHSVSDVVKQDMFKSIYRSKYDLADECIICPHVGTCGGGYLPHRFSKSNGFRNPSIYSADLLQFIEYVATKLHSEIGDMALVQVPEAKRLRGDDGVASA